MFDDTLKSKVNREVGRLNGELCDLHEQEESLKIRKARLEVEMRQAIAARDMFELFGRLSKQPDPVRVAQHEPVMPEHPNGPQFVRPPPAPSAVASPAPYNILVSPLVCPQGREVPPTIPVTLRTPAPSRAAGKQKHVAKPQGLATMEQMILEVLHGGAWTRPNQITALIRTRYWKDAPRSAAPPVAWRMGRDGKLEKSEHGYRLPGVVPSVSRVSGNGATDGSH